MARDHQSSYIRLLQPARVMQKRNVLLNILALILYASAYSQPEIEQKNTIIIYPEFKVEFINFVGFQLHDPNDGVSWIRLEYPDTSQAYGKFENDIWSIYPKKDTLDLEERYQGMISNCVMKVIPKEEDEAIRVFYSFEQRIDETYDGRNNTLSHQDLDGKKWLYWERESPYKQIADSSEFFYKIPAPTVYDKDRSTIDPEFIPNLRVEHNLRDTTVIIPGERYRYVDYTDDSQRLFIYTVNRVIIRIDRISKGAILESKYIQVGYIDGC